MRDYFAYIRVSTVKQGEHGSSLQEQRDAIERFANRNGLRITQWFEERETAAKIGRREFTRLVKALMAKKASGVVFHKIDRSARNLRDWSAVQDLADAGVDVRFAQESINLGSNEGKLTGDFLAVISAHYIRNLREEVKKGIRGRLKQGLYPFKAYIGYLDQGGGKPKIADPQRAPFVQLAFELYSERRFSLNMLSEDLYRRGFRTKTGKRVTVQRLNELLRNPFYIGVIRLKTTGESFAGVHEPLITKELFDTVQAALTGKKTGAKVFVHSFLFRRLITCRGCGYSLVGERHRGHVYYRCHTRTCSRPSLREDAVSEAVNAVLKNIVLDDETLAGLRREASAHRDKRQAQVDREKSTIDLQIANVKDRQARLVDAYVDGAVERESFEERKLALLMQQTDLEHQRVSLQSRWQERTEKFLELLKMASLSYRFGNSEEKRRLVQIVTSNFWAEPKKLVFELKSPFRELANMSVVRLGGPSRPTPRMSAQQIFHTLMSYCEAHPDSDAIFSSPPRKQDRGRDSLAINEQRRT